MFAEATAGGEFMRPVYRTSPSIPVALNDNRPAGVEFCRGCIPTPDFVDGEMGRGLDRPVEQIPFGDHGKAFVGQCF